MGVFGDTLRQARAYKGVSIKEAEQATRINRHHLAALEDEVFATLPPLIYQRGIVRNYATYLDLDAAKLLAMFEQAHGIEGGGEVVAAMKPLNMPNHWAPNFAIIAFMVVMSAIVFAWGYSAYFAPGGVATTTVAVIPTVTPAATGAAGNAGLITQTPLPVSPTADAALVALTETTPPPSGGTGAVAAALNPTATIGPAPSPTPLTAPTRAPDPTATPVPEVTPTPAPGAETIRIVAEGDIQVTVVVDGSEQYAGWLAAGESTEWFTGLAFAVYTSDGSLTLFQNQGSGDNFYMGYDLDVTYYLGQ